MAEVEPNNDFAQPQPIAMNVTVNGVADNEDVDYYAVEAKKGERITAEVEGIRLGLTLFDPYVAIMDAKRFELASSDDAALVWQDGFASVVAPEDGTYIIQVRESAYAGNANCLYRLHVGNFPRPTATVPAGGKLGETVTVPLDRRRPGRDDDEVTLPGARRPQLRPGRPGRARDRALPERLPPQPVRQRHRGRAERRPRDGHAVHPAGGAQRGDRRPGDVDHFAFPAKKGQTYDVRVFARQIRSPLDSVLTIAARDGGRVAGNDDSGGPDSYLRFTAPEDGEYVVSVADHLKKGGPDYVYRIEISPGRAAARP